MKSRFEEIIRSLSQNGITFDAGLNSEEISFAEKQYQVNFPPDLREFLMTALPVSKGFYNWRDYSLQNCEIIHDALGKPLESLYFDVEENAFWWNAWGKRPENLDDAKALAAKHLSKVPTLIPIYLHRYIPSVPNEPGNPIISMWQMVDSIYYGNDLIDYFEVEFLHKKLDIQYPPLRHIPFWSELIENANL
jgi:hypothetical protein